EFDLPSGRFFFAMIFRLITLILIIAAAIGYSHYSKTSLESQILLGKGNEAVLKTLPDAQFATLDNIPFKVDDLYSKQDVELLMIHFWGTWCAPCEAELPDLLSFIKRFEGKPEVKFLLVATNDEILKVKKHLKGLAIPVS